MWGIKHKIHMELEDIAKGINAILQGWKTYYGRFRKSEFDATLKYLDKQLMKWIWKKYTLKKSDAKAWAKLEVIKQSTSKHSHTGLLPPVQQQEEPMMREYHVRFCERLKGNLRPTRPNYLIPLAPFFLSLGLRNFLRKRRFFGVTSTNSSSPM